ncbi:Mgm101p-domain-containing protein [Viridothelium virens]|uniref:Mitochondrial genome maintenance protein MGM101 n=1 Tax=Viridothelium virens TaxID=1048519 RepID=A0A6A6HC58_VIRVR|nr:Mgm101p-domain-containing protein [Viridothelium virens]
MSLAPARRLGAGLICAIQKPERAKSTPTTFFHRHLKHHIPSTRAFTSPSLRCRQEQTTSISSRATSSSPSSSSPSAPPSSSDPGLRSLTDGLDDPPPLLSPDEKQVDWTRSFHGLSNERFSKEAADALLERIDEDDIEIKPDGIIYLPEIKYRRILNRAFGPGGWGLAPRGETIVTGKLVTREYALVANGRLVSVARGEQVYFDPEGIPTATEGCKSNALMRCCKDLGVASEMWDPRFIRKWLGANAKEVWVEHVVNKKRKKIWIRKDDAARYPFKEVPARSA